MGSKLKFKYSSVYNHINKLINVNYKRSYTGKPVGALAT